MPQLPVPEPHPSKSTIQRSTSVRLARIMDSNHPLCREDIVWALNVIKQQLTDHPDKWAMLEPNQLVRRFHSYAEISSLLVYSSSYGQESDRIRKYLAELVSGLYE
ncbi:methyltransferase [Paenibacillus sp. E194]|jgi:hypothetical protein|uniref:Uncharacterized protein n=2 Tax=Paenibacillus alvei TaxID=44250 RepID=S9SXB1_PAEAL|nr:MULTISPECIES: hypothetical protein [Paenibacillus]EPY08758.1 hypothetical protein PAALTS15_02272 [Paenibacillus alvei TS-15]KJB85140.1 methyltransferase [Paenibacillus sp. E194]SYX82638.1 Methyltransferase [Paenibacillus alvei]